MEQAYIADPEKAYMKCFKTDDERCKYMYMHSIGNEHYFKNIQTRFYKIIKKKL